jgi:hypothetical protein
VTIATYRTGLLVIVAVFAIAAAAWLFSLGPLGPWHWHEVARMRVPASPPVADYQQTTGGPYATSGPFHLSGHDVRLAVTSLALPSEIAGHPLHGDVVWEVSRAAAPRADGDHTTPGLAGLEAMQGSAPGTVHSDWVHSLGPLPVGQYHLFAYATAATTLVVRDSRAEKGPVLLLLGGLALALAVWILLWHLGPRRVLP